VDAPLHVQQPFFTAAFVFHKVLSRIRQKSARGRAAVSRSPHPQLSPSSMFKLIPSLTNSSALKTRLLIAHVVDASLSVSRRLIELQNKLLGPRQIVGNILRCGDSELNAFRILATFSALFLMRLWSQGQNPFVGSSTLQGLVRLH
jgi:hypothetical protein